MIVTEEGAERFIGFPQNLIFVRSRPVSTTSPGDRTFLKVAGTDPASAALRCVYFSTEMQRQWHAINHNPMLAKEIYYGEITPENLPEIRAELWKERIQLLTAEDLLTAELVELSESFAAHPNVLAPYLLPIRPLVFAFLDLSQLMQRLTITEEANSTRRARLRLPIAGGEAEGMEVTVEATFEYSATRRASLMTTMAQWPSFRDPEVRQDLLLTSVEATQLRPVAGISRDRMARALAEALDLRHARGFSERIDVALEAEQTARYATLTESAGLSRILLDLGPGADAVVCRLTTGASVVRGILALPNRTLVPEPHAARNWIVGIDFGTTNTAIAIRDPDDDASHTTTAIGGNVALPLDHNKGAREQLAGFSANEAEFEFIPALPQLSFPIMTILETRTNVRSELMSAHARVPYISIIVGQSWVKRMMARPDEIRFNLKWLAVDSPVRQYVRHFLEQIVSQILVESRARQVASARIQWRWTLPRSLPPQLAAAFQSDVGDVMSTAVSNSSSREVRFYTESESLFYYALYHDSCAFGDLMIAFDIGGRSTDIAIFSTKDKELLWDGSLQLGGRILLIDYWIKNLNAIAPLLESHLGVSLQGLTADEGATKVRTAILELLVNQTQAQDALWRQICSDDETERIYRYTRARARTALLGLIYYIIKYALPEALGGDRPENLKVGFFFGGRGARLFDSLCTASPDLLLDHATINSWLKASGLGDSHGLSFSKSPKMEVAMGVTLAERAPSPATEILRPQPTTPSAPQPANAASQDDDAHASFQAFCKDVSAINDMVDLTSAPGDQKLYAWRNAAVAKELPGSAVLHVTRRHDANQGTPSRSSQRSDLNQGLDFIFWLRALLEHFDSVAT